MLTRSAMLAAAISALSAFATSHVAPTTQPTTQPTTTATHSAGENIEGNHAESEPLAKLVQQLASEDVAVREAAEASIIALGTNSLPALRQLFAEATDPEVQDRLERSIVVLERAKLIEPTRVTIKLENPTAVELAQEVGKSFGLRASSPDQIEHFNRMPQFNKKLGDVELIDVTWKEATEFLRRRGAMTIRIDNSGTDVPSFFIQPGGNPEEQQGRQIDLGIVRIAATNISYNWSQPIGPVGGAKPRENSSLSIQFMALGEPRLLNPAVLQSAQFQFIEVIDSNGNSILNKQNKLPWSVRNGEVIAQAAAALKMPKNPGDSIKSIRGELVLRLVNAFDVFQSDQVAVGQPISVVLGDDRLNLVVTNEGMNMSVELSGKMQRLDIIDGRNQQIPINDLIRISVVDSLDLPLLSQGINTYHTNQEVKLSNLFLPRVNQPGKGQVDVTFPLKVKVTRVRSTTEVTIPFEFLDLPMIPRM